ncbi:PD-(D/E)XK nuclease family protein [Arcicella lustrica]|uniref:PD-(D/E)XK nuclease family protein n=1 Tax=Arcicella lustrica TaxID=2984196 RepID=A0ABU5SDP5_9BACT|nr:PD-(D/E)XK nuclease family protein [Arcicella sp. DC25W]MEA5425419.1 PD-(D/E)XK nuclease family protein [Arcicella sp. DC25W]
MQTFLDQAAEYIFKQHSLNQLSRVCIVIPSRRGVLYFKDALAKLSDKPFLAPDVLAIDDFVNTMTGVRQIDQVALLFELYDVFKEIDPNVVFERFMTWASTLLNDFDKIDQYLVDAKALFSYMTEAKAIERWQMQLGESQKDKNLKTDRTDRYFKLFENIFTVYQNLRQRLADKGLHYRGMAYRELAENVEKYILSKERHTKYYFVGFNALSDAEEKIIRTLLKRKDFAETLWDSDAYYLYNKDQKAGNWLRYYKNGDEKNGITPLFNEEWKWQSDELLKGKKKIQIIGVANASVQAKVAGHIFKDWENTSKTDATVPKSQTAIVLGDENLLVPVMNSLDESVKDFNVTMGLSLRNSMLFTLVDALFELQKNLVEFKTEDGGTVKIPKFSHRQIVRVLNHPFLRRYELIRFKVEQNEPKENPIRKTLREITERNRVFLSSKELLEIAENEPLFESIFKHWHNKPKNAVKCFYELIDLLREVYKENQDAIETEYLYQFYLILQRMEVILEERGDTVSIRSFKTFLYELIKQTKIPFESETDESLQIMGMLETRTLDFEKVIILSVNEKTLPQGKRQNTLIPFDALSDPQFNLPTHNHADAVMAYHFFRLMQRAKEVVLVHVLPSDTYGAGEKSRFILQIEHELSKLNPNLDITYPNVKFIGLEETEDKEETPLLIQKTADILAFIEQEITEKGIFPSQINQFLDCSLKYYFTRIAGIAQEEEVEEKIGADTFGNWIHKTFENIDKTFVEKGSKVEKEDLQTVLENIDTYLKEAFLQTNQGLKADDGMNFILYQIGETIVKKFINYQLENEVFPIELLDVEKTLKVTFNAQVNDKVLPVKIAGRIDRLDRVSGNKIRVIDYKTGKVEAKELTMKPEDLEEKLLGDTDKDKFRQLWLYKYMVLKQMLSTRGLSIRGTKLPEIDNEVSAGIYSFRNIDAGLLEQKIAFNAGETAMDFVVDSEKYLQQFVSDLLNPETPFEKTKDQDKCQYCDYKRICGR